MDYEINATWDDSSIGREEDHYVFPAKTKVMERAYGEVSGGIYVKKPMSLGNGDRIIITLKGRT